MRRREETGIPADAIAAQVSEYRDLWHLEPDPSSVKPPRDDGAPHR